MNLSSKLNQIKSISTVCVCYKIQVIHKINKKATFTSKKHIFIMNWMDMHETYNGCKLNTILEFGKTRKGIKKQQEQKTIMVWHETCLMTHDHALTQFPTNFLIFFCKAKGLNGSCMHPWLLVQSEVNPSNCFIRITLAQEKKKQKNKKQRTKRVVSFTQLGCLGQAHRK